MRFKKNIYNFTNNGKTFEINEPFLPEPWINYLSNGKLHAFVSQAGGGMVWYKSAIDCRITRYRLNTLPKDAPGFYIYIVDGDGVWSPTFKPVETPLDSWKCEHSFMKTKFIATKNGVEATLLFYVAQDTNTIVWDLSLKNMSGVDKKLKVYAYCEMSQYLWQYEQWHGYYWRHMLNTYYDSKNEILYYFYHFPVNEHDKKTMPLTYFACNRKIVSYDTDRDVFIGNYRSEKNPIALVDGNCKGSVIDSGEPCGAIKTEIICKTEQTERIKFFLGVAEGAISNFDKAKETAIKEVKLLREDIEDKQLEKVNNFSKEYLNYFNCTLPDEKASWFLNYWSPLNVLNTARYSRSVNAEAPGVRKIGYRDTSQDTCSIAFRMTDLALSNLKLLLSKQLKDGSSAHETSDSEDDVSVVRTRCDDHLWPILLAYKIAVETGVDFLSEQVCLLGDDLISKGESLSIWDHLVLATQFTEKHKGIHGLPLTLHGDWNDIIGKFSEKGHGESVFCAEQYVYLLGLMIEMADKLGEKRQSQIFAKNQAEMIDSIKKYAWNGKWWYRCFDDNGLPIGSEKDTYGKIWINSQTWAVISNSGTKEQQIKAMDAAGKYLDTGMGLQKLAPGFKSYPIINDPFSTYNPGCGENGAVFCHAHTWSVIAEALLGRGDTAWKYFSDLLPYNCAEKVGVERYRIEPYAYASSILSDENSKRGQGNVSHLTGTAAWMDMAAREYILGFRPNLDGVVFSPCIPTNWKEFSFNRKYHGCLVKVKVLNNNGKSTGFEKILVNGKEYSSQFVKNELFNAKNLDICLFM